MKFTIQEIRDYLESQKFDAGDHLEISQVMWNYGLNNAMLALEDDEDGIEAVTIANRERKSK